MRKPEGTGRMSFRLSQAENARDYMDYAGAFTRRMRLKGYGVDEKAVNHEGKATKMQLVGISTKGRYF